MANTIEDRGNNNEVYVGENITLVGSLSGDNNRIHLASAREPSVVHLYLNGDNNVIHFEHAYTLKDLVITVGSHIASHDVVLKVDKNFSIEPGGRIYLYTSGGSLSIGEHCMFSTNIKIRCGESPHLIFEKDSGKFLDVSKEMKIGNHVWIGEDVYLTKSASIAAECIVGACSVVTRAFPDQNCVIAGNPARVVRQNIQWIRNKHYLEKDSKYARSHDAFHAMHPGGFAAASASGSTTHAQPEETPLSRAFADIAKQKLELLAMTRRIHDLEHSTSWRITAPIRQLLDAIRRAKS